MLFRKKYAIYGGTFDPIHMAHIILADIAVKEIELDELIFMPAYISPFKQDIRISSGENRYNMISEILNFNPAFRVSDYEISLKLPSYTINTLEYFDDLDDNKLYFLLGFDSLMEIETWHRGADILKKFPLLTGYRPGTVENDVIRKIEYFKDKYDAVIHVLDMPPLDISATDIRQRILNGYSIKGLVHPKVEEYIFDNKLYNRHALEEYLKKNLTPVRYKHSLSVEKMAGKLARIHGADPDKAEFAGRYHDIAKCFSIEKANKLVIEYGLPKKYLNNTALSHSKIAAEILSHEFGVTDEDILNAVRSHTTGRAGMSLLEEIVYVADAIEENRNYSELLELQQTAYSDLDAACFEIINFAMQMVKDKGKAIDEDTIKARKFIKKRLEKKYEK